MTHALARGTLFRASFVKEMGGGDLELLRNKIFTSYMLV